MANKFTTTETGFKLKKKNKKNRKLRIFKRRIQACMHALEPFFLSNVELF